MKVPLAFLPILLTGCYTQLQVLEPSPPSTRMIVVREVIRETSPDQLMDEDTLLYEEEETVEMIRVRDRSRALWTDRDYRRGFADGYRYGYDDGDYDNYRRDRWHWNVHWGWGWHPYVHHPYYSGYYGHPYWRYHSYYGWGGYNRVVVYPNRPDPVTNVNQGRRNSGVQGTTSTGSGRVRSSGTVNRSTEATRRSGGTAVRRESGSSGSTGTRTESRPASRPASRPESRPKSRPTRSDSGSDAQVERRSSGSGSSSSRPASGGSGTVRSGGSSSSSGSSGSGSSRPARRD
jgi:hypothetical protein